jgi:hypothetical protein
LHAAGFINFDRLFVDRGVQGVCWSTLQGDLETGWYMRFRSTESIVSGNEKEMSVSIRFIKD